MHSWIRMPNHGWILSISITKTATSYWPKADNAKFYC